MCFSWHSSSWKVLQVSQIPLGLTRSFRFHQVSPNPSGPWVLQVASGLTSSHKTPPGLTRSLDAPGPIRSHQAPSGPWVLQISPGLTTSSRTFRSLGAPDPIRSHQIPPGFTKSFRSLGIPGVRSRQVTPNPVSNLGVPVPTIPPSPTRSHQLPSGSWVLQIPPGLTKSFGFLGAPDPGAHKVPPSPISSLDASDPTRSHQILQVFACSRSHGAPCHRVSQLP